MLLGLGSAVVALAGALVFAELTESVLGNGGATSVDQRVTRWVVVHRSEWLTDVLRPGTHLADPVVVAAVTTLVVVVLLRQRRLWLAGFMTITAAGTPLLVQAVKAIVDRPRPPTSDRLVAVTGAAFPSGHAAQSVACYVAIAVIIGWITRSPSRSAAAGSCALAIAALVGSSRIYLGVHWTSDVVAGWMLGITWLTTTSTALVMWSTLRHKLGPRTGRLDRLEAGSSGDPRPPEPEG